MSSSISEFLGVIFFIGIIARLALVVGLVLAAAYAYRRFRMPTMPWLIVYLLILSAHNFVGTLIASAVVDHQMKNRTLIWGMTAGSFVAFTAALSSFLATFGYSIAAWLLIAEFAFVLSNGVDAGLGVPRFMLMPRGHSTCFGITLLVTGLGMPAIWSFLLVRG